MIIGESEVERLVKHHRPWINQDHAPAAVSLPVGEELARVVLTDAVVRCGGVEVFPLRIQDESDLPALAQDDIRLSPKGVLAGAVRRQMRQSPGRAPVYYSVIPPSREIRRQQLRLTVGEHIFHGLLAGFIGADYTILIGNLAGVPTPSNAKEIAKIALDYPQLPAGAVWVNRDIITFALPLVSRATSPRGCRLGSGKKLPNSAL